MKIKESAENYLETILVLSRKKNDVRAIDIANEMGFSKPSVSVAMKNFREAGYVSVDDDGFIRLTQKGMEVAEKIYERHNVIAGFLIAIGVDEQTAYDDSCKIEHCLSDATFEKLKEFLESNK